MEIRVCECQKQQCHYRWIPRTGNKYGVSETVPVAEPKECPCCKHQFSGYSWSVKAKCWTETVNNVTELKTLKASIKKWNYEGRFAEY
jgi:hypothetical protein